MIGRTAAVILLVAASGYSRAQAQSATPEEARAIAKEAYIYGFPMVDNYRIQYAYFVDTKNPEYKAPWNQIVNIPRVYTPADTAIQTPNSDTPYSLVGLDLRAEPMVLTVPPIEKDRYFSVQLIDCVHVQLRLHRQPRDRQRWRQLPHRRAGLEGRDAQGRQRGDPLGDRARLRGLPHAAFQSGRPRQRQEDPGRLQGASRCRRFSASPRRRPRRRSTSSSR